MACGPGILGKFHHSRPRGVVVEILFSESSGRNLIGIFLAMTGHDLNYIDPGMVQRFYSMSEWRSARLEYIVPRSREGEENSYFLI